MIALVLFHGRHDPAESLDDWGEDGPVFLVSWIHVTYLWRITVGLEDHADPVEIQRVDDLLYYNGVYYGDWSVLTADEAAADDGYAARLIPLDPKKAVR